MNKAIGFIGLGVMGFPMAGHLANDYKNIAVFNRTKKKSEDWNKKFSGIVCKSSEEVARVSDVIIICVGNDKDVKDIISGDNGILNDLKPGSIIIDHTTTSADLSKEINTLLNPKKVFYLDAPASPPETGASK